jgi:hypothetical protein
MKYFTKELWTDFQDMDKGHAADEQWAAALAEYRAQLQSLQPRLSALAFEFFADADVHDGTLLHFRIGDRGSETSPIRVLLPREGDEWYSRDYPVVVDLEVLEGGRPTRWNLAYRHVRRVFADFPTDRPLFYSDGDGFEDWGYHELTDAGDGFLRHEVLFSSGATLLTEFREINVTKVESDPPNAVID